jgi:hypothetical protein
LVVSKPIVNDSDVCHLDWGGSACVFRKRSDCIIQHDSGWGLICSVGMRVYPQFWMIRVAAAILVDDIEKPVAVHRHAFHRHVRHAQRTAWIGHNRQPAGYDAGPVDVDDLARFLADHEQVGEIRTPAREPLEIRETD